jgi:superfamily I DNA/RNA helicase
MTDTYVEQIDGAPGAGKTYQLRKRLEKEADQGLGLVDFYWLNFTNSGREDVEPEIEAVYAADDTDVDADSRAKTFHGLALSLVLRDGAITPETFDSQILQQGDYGADEFDPYADFCRREGMSYDPDYSDPKKLLSGVQETTHTGNLLFAIDDYLTQTCKPPEKWRSAPVDIPINNSDRVAALLEAWDDYKRKPPMYEFRLFEHGDYVEYAADRGLTADVDVLFIDEFQDLAPLEYRLYKLWRDDSGLERLYIAGDPNQSIYSFRGGTPYYFDATDTDDVVELKDSRRCPEQIAAVGREVLATHGDTDPRGFDGYDPGGTVQWRSTRDKYDLRDAVIEATDPTDDGDQLAPAVLLLTRTNHQLRELTSDLRDVGVPFDILGTRRSMWNGDLGDMLAVLNGIENGTDTFHLPAVRTLCKKLRDDVDYARGFGQLLTSDQLDDVLGHYKTVQAIIRRLEIPKWKRDVLMNAVDAPAAIQRGEVQVGTVHTAKGLEAPTVYLFTTTSDSMVTRYARNPDAAAEEHRVYYVGATRASERLYLVDDYFEGPTAPPIDKIRYYSEVVA